METIYKSAVQIRCLPQMLLYSIYGTIYGTTVQRLAELHSEHLQLADYCVFESYEAFFVQLWYRRWYWY